jgi:hypothetical protein
VFTEWQYREERIMAQEKPNGPARETEKRPPAEPISGERARQGQIVLNTRTKRIIFFGGLIAFVILAFVLGVSVW